MVISLYSVINLFAFLVCLLILIRRIKMFDNRKVNSIFIGLVISAMGILFMDYLWGVYDSMVATKDFVTSYIINAVYYLFLGSTPLIWFIYSENVQNSKIANNKKYLILCCIPSIVYLVLVITSAFGFGFFTIGENGEYFRGQLYIYQVIQCYAYLLLTCVKACILAFRNENYAKRNSYLILAGFIVLPAIFGVLQVVFFGVPFLSLGIALAIAQAHIQMQEELISLDSLTGINNRSQMIKYLSSKMNDKNSHSYLVILDLDNFKSINDIYGHVEGDKALIRVAEVLRMYSNKYKAFISRYAGDEFIMIIDSIEALDDKQISQELNLMISELNVHDDVKYKLNISVGMTKIDHSIDSIPKYIELADKALYENKKR